MEFNVGWPEGILIALALFGILVTAASHGKDKGKHNFPVTFMAVLIEMILLLWGGFFS
jgi:hypothetical protein